LGDVEVGLIVIGDQQSLPADGGGETALASGAKALQKTIIAPDKIISLLQGAVILLDQSDRLLGLFGRQRDGELEGGCFNELLPPSADALWKEHWPLRW
jgi:hypothetical protein